MHEPLKNCPFCGGINIIHCGHHMYCHACGADGPDADSQHESEARSAWNRRTPQPVAREPLTCEWTHNDDDGYWDTSCGGDDESIQQAEIDLHRLQHIESAALLALGMLWMTERHSPNAQAAFQTLRNALGGQDALRRGIEAAIDAGFEADHPPGADWWAGKKEGKP